MCDTEYTSKDVIRRRSSRQSESTNRSSMCVRHCRFWKRPPQRCSWPHTNTHKQWSFPSSSTRLLTIARMCRDRSHSPSGERSQNSVQRHNGGYQLYNKKQTTEHRCRKCSSREFRRRSKFHSYSFHRKRCEPRLRTRRGKRPSMSEILSISLL